MISSLKPGSRLNITDLNSNVAGEAEILDLCPGEHSLLLLTEMTFNPGDTVIIEAPRWEDGLYLFQAAVRRRDESNGAYELRLMGKPQLLQRRRAERIPANQPMEYVLLSEKKKDQDFHEGLILNISRTGALLAVKEPLRLDCQLFLIFELNVNRDPLPREKTIPTGIVGRVVREHPLKAAACPTWERCYGVEFEKPFAALTG